MSRYPILNSQMIGTQASGRRRLRAACYEVQLPTWTVVVYNVHQPSPRKELKGQGLVIHPSESTRQFWQDQEMLMQQVLQHMESEVLPVVVCGDWKAPPVEPLYRRMTAQLTDAHMAVGGGAGYTFSGNLWNPLTLGKPWLRLDYILCNAECEVLQCETEAPSEAQHAAVGAVLRSK
ncbi:MAG: endonuclease/exonuclease/phosphatase family protein [Verrucomicrobiaceae bacterium]